MIFALLVWLFTVPLSLSYYRATRFMLPFRSGVVFCRRETWHKTRWWQQLWKYQRTLYVNVWNVTEKSNHCTFKRLHFLLSLIWKSFLMCRFLPFGCVSGTSILHVVQVLVLNHSYPYNKCYYYMADIVRKLWLVSLPVHNLWYRPGLLPNSTLAILTSKSWQITAYSKSFWKTAKHSELRKFNEWVWKPVYEENTMHHFNTPITELQSLSRHVQI